MRRIALYSDIHGNVPALEAVVADIDRAGAGERYCLGDLVGYGPDPTGVIERIRASGVPTIRGNYDQGVGDRSGACGCYYPTDQAKSDGASSYEFTERSVGDEDAAWLLGLHDEIRIEEAGVRILLTHGSPRRINEYLMPDRGEKQLLRLAREAAADVVCTGHVHIPYHRSFPDVGAAEVAAEGADAVMLDGAADGAGQRMVHYVNSGSVGKPKDGDPRACWVELLVGSAEEVRAAAPDDGYAASAGESPAWVGLRIHRVAYDIETVTSAMTAAGLPETLAESLRTA